MATTKPLFSLCSQAAVLLLLFVLAAQNGMVQSQGCTTELNNLNVCAPFVVPGATNSIPSGECCTALNSVQHDCICNTLRIAARLPSQCNLPPLNCDT